MKINVVSFEAIECSALRRLVEYVGENTITAKLWKVTAAMGVLRKKMPLAGAHINTDAEKPTLDAAYAFASNTNADDHRDAGLTDDESQAMWGLYLALGEFRPLAMPVSQSPVAA